MVQFLHLIAVTLNSKIAATWDNEVTLKTKLSRGQTWYAYSNVLQSLKCFWCQRVPIFKIPFLCPKKGDCLNRIKSRWQFLWQIRFVNLRFLRQPLSFMYVTQQTEKNVPKNSVTIFVHFQTRLPIAPLVAAHCRCMWR